MQRIATPMIGGMVWSTALTLVVIPTIYAMVKGLRIPDAGDLSYFACSSTNLRHVSKSCR
jgi:Cu(I)/Ag(I) efflux system membrane protein CusA/SilA